MVKRDMKKALGASLKAEEQAVRTRFELSKTVLSETLPVLREQPKPDGTAQDIRDTITLPDGEDELISRIKRRCMKAGLRANRDEVLMAGLAALDAMRDRKLERLFEHLRRVKTGRRSREIHIFILHRADAVKFRRPLHLKRSGSARKVIIGRKIVTIPAGKTKSV